MNVYFDSAIIVKLYVPELSSIAATNIVERFQGPIPMTALQQCEVFNAILLKQARAELTAMEANKAFQRFSEDFENERWRSITVDWNGIFMRAREIAKQYTPATKARTLDILHVAAAEQLMSETFVSFDLRQIATATAIGLNVIST